MEDKLMDKNEKIKVAGLFHRATKEQHSRMKSADNHTYYLRVQKKKSGIVVHSLEALKEREFSGVDVIADQNTDVAETVIKNILLYALEKAKEELDPNERLLIELLYNEDKTEEEAGKVFGITQQAVSKRHKKIIQKLKKIMKI